MFRYLFFVFALFSLVACSTTDGGSSGGSAPKIDWPKSTGTVKIKDTVKIGKKDYGFKTVDGSGLAGDGGQAENQEAPFWMNKSASLSKVIAKSWPESISGRAGPNTLRHVYIPDVGEDAYSTYKNHSVKGILIEDCSFAKATDKILQFNEGSGKIVIRRCKFDGFKSAIRIKVGVTDVLIEDCIFMNGSGAIVLDPGVKKPTIKNCKFYNVTYEIRQD